MDVNAFLDAHSGITREFNASVFLVSQHLAQCGGVTLMNERYYTRSKTIPMAVCLIQAWGPCRGP